MATKSAPKKGDLTTATPSPDIPQSTGGSSTGRTQTTAPAQGTTNGSTQPISKPKK